MMPPPGFDQNASIPPGGMPPGMMYPPGYPQMPYDPNMQWPQGQMPPYGVQSGSGYPQVPYPNMPDPQAMAQAQAQMQMPPQPQEQAQYAPSSSPPANPLDVEDDPFTQHVGSDFGQAPKGDLPLSPLDKDEDPFASVTAKGPENLLDSKAEEDSIGALLAAKLKEADPFSKVEEPEKIEKKAPPPQEEKSAEDMLDALLNSRLKEENPPLPPPAVQKEEEDSIGALLAAKLKESSGVDPSFPSLTKAEPPGSSSVLGQLLGALQDEEEDAPPANNSLGSALSAAVDDMFSESALKGNSDVQQVGLSEIKSLKSLNSSPEASNEMADAVDKWLDNVESGQAKKESGFGAVAAKLSEVMGDDEEVRPAPSLVNEPQAFGGESPKEKKGSHTSDALSRLLAAASMENDVPTQS